MCFDFHLMWLCRLANCHHKMSASPVVNDHVLSAVIKLPAVSFTPLDPPVIVAVYVVEAASDDVGSNVVTSTTQCYCSWNTGSTSLKRKS